MTKLFLVAAALVALQLLAPPPEVKGARMTVRPTAAATMSVTVENRRESALVAVQIVVPPHDRNQGMQISTFEFRPAEAGRSTDSAPIGPKERRTLELQLVNLPAAGVADIAEVRLAVFADGFAEGVASALEAWRTTRRDRADDLAYWVGVFETMPRVSEPDVRTYLTDWVADRGGRFPADASGLRARVQNALRQGAPGRGTVWPLVDTLRAEARADLAAMRQQLPDSRVDETPATIASVAFSFHTTASTDYVADIENLRDVPIQAYGFKMTDTGSGQVSGQTRDGAFIDPDLVRAGYGPIRPHEIREVSLRAGTLAGVPLVRLSFVMFDDWSVEGSSTDADQLLRDREASARDYAFAIDTIRKAATLPPAEAAAFLTRARGEHAAAVDPTGRSGQVYLINEFMRRIASSSDNPKAIADVMVPTLELQRQRLVRHLAR